MLGAAKVVGGVFAVEGLVHLAESVAKSAASQESELAAVRQSIATTGAAWKVHGDTVAHILEEEASKSGFAVTELAQGFIRIESSVRDSAKALDLLGSAEDVARARHLGLAQASQLLARASLGSYGALTRLGIVIPKVGQGVAGIRREHDAAVASGVKFNAQQQQAYKQSIAQAGALDAQATKARLVAEVEKRFGGQSERFAQTSAGQLARLTENLTSLGASIGNDLLPEVNAGAEGIGRYVTELRHSESVHTAVRGTVAGLTTVFRDAKDIIEDIAPAVGTVTHALSGIAGAAGGVNGILVIAAGYRSVGVATNIAAAARRRYDAVLAAGRGESVARVTAEEAQTVAYAANTAAIHANTAAMLENLAVGVGGSRLKISAATSTSTGAYAANTVAVEANTLAVAENAAVATVGAGRAALLGRSLLSLAGGPYAVAAVATAALSFGIYKLVTAETEAEKRGDALAKSLDRYSDAAARSRETTKQLAESVSSVKSDRIAVATARTNLEVARQAVATASAARGSVQYRQAIDQLAQAQDSLRVSQRQLAADEAAVASHRRARAKEQVDQEIARLEAIQKTDDLARAVRRDTLSQVVTQGPAGRGAAARASGDIAAFAQAKIAASAFADQLDRIAAKENDVGLRSRESDLAAFARAAGRLPTASEINLTLNAPNEKAALDGLVRVLERMRRRAAAEGFASGKAFAEAFRRGQTGEGGLFGDLLAEIGTIVGKAKAAPANAVKDVSKASLDAAQNTLDATRTTLDSFSSKIRDATDEVRNAGNRVRDANQAVADAIRAGAASVASAVQESRSNLLSIGSQLSDEIGQLIDAQNKTGDLATSVDAATFRRLRAQILAGQGGEDTRRAAQELAGRLQAKQGEGNDDLEKRKERVRRGIADLVVEFNKGAISLATFNKRLAALLAREGATYKAAGKVLGLAFAEGFQASVAGLKTQAAAIAAGPKGRGITGQEPSIIRPLDALRESQRQIASAQRNRDDALRAEVKATKHLEALQEQRQRLQLAAEREQRRLAGLTEQHLRFIKQELQKQTDLQRQLVSGRAGAPKPPRRPPRGERNQATESAIQGLR